MKVRIIFCMFVIMFLIVVPFSMAEPFTYHWEIDETPAGSEKISVIKPIEVEMLDGTMKISNSTASILLARKYSIYLSEQFDNQHAQLLLSAFETVPEYFYQPLHFQNSMLQLGDVENAKGVCQGTGLGMSKNIAKAQSFN